MDSLGEFLVWSHHLVADAYEEDPNRWNTFQDFQRSLTNDHIDEVVLGNSPYAVRLTYPGIFPFIQQQKEWLAKQFAGWDYDCPLAFPTTYSLKVYPNPAHQFVTIVSDAPAEFEYSAIQIYNTSGQLVLDTKSKFIPQTGEIIDISNLPFGFYFVVQLDSNGDKGFGKLIIY